MGNNRNPMILEPHDTRDSFGQAMTVPYIEKHLF
jgi:hypothetical protein